MTTLYALWQGGIHFDATITLGNVLTALVLTVAIIKFWTAQVEVKKDLEWRIANLETWRKENQIDGKAKEILFDKLTEIVSKLRWVDEARQKQRSAPPGKQRLGDIES